MTQTPEHSGDALVIQKVQPFGPGGEAAIVLSTTATDADGHLHDRCSAYHENRSPPLVWTPVEGAVAYAIVVEDPDAPREHPFVHWLIWNIPGEATSLPEGLPNEPSLGRVGGAVQGVNGKGTVGWFGPRPPPGHGLHRYHFQIFALAERLSFGPNVPLETLVNALKADTLADGLMVAMYEAPEAQ